MTGFNENIKGLLIYFKSPKMNVINLSFKKIKSLKIHIFGPKKYLEVTKYTFLYFIFIIKCCLMLFLTLILNNYFLGGLI